MNPDGWPAEEIEARLQQAGEALERLSHVFARRRRRARRRPAGEGPAAATPPAEEEESPRPQQAQPQRGASPGSSARMRAASIAASFSPPRREKWPSSTKSSLVHDAPSGSATNWHCRSPASHTPAMRALKSRISPPSASLFTYGVQPGAITRPAAALPRSSTCGTNSAVMPNRKASALSVCRFRTYTRSTSGSRSADGCGLPGDHRDAEAPGPAAASRTSSAPRATARDARSAAAGMQRVDLGHAVAGVIRLEAGPVVVADVVPARRRTPPRAAAPRARAAPSG